MRSGATLLEFSFVNQKRTLQFCENYFDDYMYTTLNHVIRVNFYGDVHFDIGRLKVIVIVPLVW